MCWKIPAQATQISIHKALASLDNQIDDTGTVPISISIHKALASLDRLNPVFKAKMYISIHKALASLDVIPFQHDTSQREISIHKALASLDAYRLGLTATPENFNPQGSREPRLLKCSPVSKYYAISIHKALASLDRRDGCYRRS